MKLTAIILAGGKSSRMGTDKGLVLLNGKPMIQHIIEAVQKTEINDILIISNNLAYKQFGLPVYSDIIKESGPLGGIYTGLVNSTTSRNMILSCDIPFINDEVMNVLLEDQSQSPITVLKYKDRIHPLIGIFNTSIIPDIQEQISKNNLKVRELVQSKNATIIDLEKKIPELKSHVVANVNTKNDLKEYADEM